MLEGFALESFSSAAIIKWARRRCMETEEPYQETFWKYNDI